MPSIFGNEIFVQTFPLRTFRCRDNNIDDMSQSMRPYLASIERTLQSSLCLQNFASQQVERHNFPEIEAKSTKLCSPELLLKPIIISRNENERCLIEASINSVRISIRVKQSDEIEELLARNFMRFLMQRAEDLGILRRKPLPGYDISFLVTNFHIEDMHKQNIIDFIIEFIQDIDKEISEMKLGINARGRLIASEFLKQFV